jgi:hypothetical protein
MLTGSWHRETRTEYRFTPIFPPFLRKLDKLCGSLSPTQARATSWFGSLQACRSPSDEEDVMPKSKSKLETKKLGRVIPLKKK